MARRLTDTQLIILSNASQRENLSVLPLPDTLKLPGGAIKKSLASLLTRGLIEEAGTPTDDTETRPVAYKLTRAGLTAIGVQDGDDESTAVKAAKITVKKKEPASAKSNTAKPGTKPSGKPDLLLRLMRRKQGATVAALQEATGWQPHSVRAALSGLRKKGVTITRDRNAKGDTLYRVEA